MSYFTTRKVFLTPSFDLNVKEEEKILSFLHLLEESNVASIINKCVKNNTSQVEGVFGNEKQNRNYTRIRRRGLNKTSAEAMLVLLGLNIRKLFKYYETKTLPKFWIAPEDLKPQTYKKASAKKLSKKGKRLNEKQYANKQA